MLQHAYQLRRETNNVEIASIKHQQKHQLEDRNAEPATLGEHLDDQMTDEQPIQPSLRNLQDE